MPWCCRLALHPDHGVLVSCLMILGEVDRALLFEALAGIALTQDLALGPVLATSIAACDAAVWESGTMGLDQPPRGGCACVQLVGIFVGKLQRPFVRIDREACSPLGELTGV